MPDGISDRGTEDEKRDADDDTAGSAFPDRRAGEREAGAGDEPDQRALAPVAADG